MTDNEIINDFEKEIKYVRENEKYDDFNPIVDIDLCENILDLIHRKNAEIERLQKSLEEAVSCFNRMESLYKIKCKELEIAKSEARKEFAERLKEEMSCEDDCGYHCSDCYYECKDYVPVINNVLREMEGSE